MPVKCFELENLLLVSLVVYKPNPDFTGLCYILHYKPKLNVSRQEKFAIYGGNILSNLRHFKSSAALTSNNRTWQGRGRIHFFTFCKLLCSSAEGGGFPWSNPYSNWMFLRCKTVWRSNMSQCSIIIIIHLKPSINFIFSCIKMTWNKICFSHITVS